MGATKLILAINAGSSSVKVAVFTAEKDHDPKPIAEAQVTGLTSDEAHLKYTCFGDKASVKNESTPRDDEVSDHAAAFKLILKALTQEPELHATLPSPSSIGLVVHRVVHGGDYTEPKVIDPKVLDHIQSLSDLAPLHNGAALSIVRACLDDSLLPSATNVACFDTQFHSTIPPHIRTYAIDPARAKRNGLRKYGFHGLSYAFIARASAEFLGTDSLDDLSIIALHLGSGASACAVKNGRSWDTSMGLSPVDGLPGATRSGAVDPSLIFHYTSHASKLSPSSTKELHISTAEEILNKESGWKALTGTTDFGAIADSDEEAHKLAFDMMVDRICGFVGSYYVSLDGKVDALVFAGGIGEKSAKLREAVARRVQCLGFKICKDKNEGDLEKVVESVGRQDSRHAILVCQTDEQFEMARTCSRQKSLWS